MSREGKRKNKIHSKRVIGVHKRPKEPIDYGVTKDQFCEILDKASQPTKNDKQEQR